MSISSEISYPTNNSQLRDNERDPQIVQEWKTSYSNRGISETEIYSIKTIAFLALAVTGVVLGVLTLPLIGIIALGGGLIVSTAVASIFLTIGLGSGIEAIRRAIASQTNDIHWEEVEDTE
jgi:hypothetical protein